MQAVTKPRKDDDSLQKISVRDRIEVDGTSLEYVERGKGVPVVFVHGGISDLRTWNHQMDAFAPLYHAIAYSRRYHGGNAPIAEGADDPDTPHVNDLAAFVKAKKLGPAHLVGNSHGAFVCLRLAAREPGLARSLVLGEPPVLPLFVSTPPKPREIIGLMLRSPSTARALAYVGTKVMKPATEAFRRGDTETGMRAFAEGVLGVDGFKSLPEERLNQMRANVAPLKAELLGAGFEAFSKTNVRSVQTPTLLVGGEHSPRFLAKILDRLQEHLPDAKRVVIPGASHLMHEQNPTRYNETILEFLSQH